MTCAGDGSAPRDLLHLPPHIGAAISAVLVSKRRSAGRRHRRPGPLHMLRSTSTAAGRHDPFHPFCYLLMPCAAVVAVGLWATRSVVHQVHSLSNPLKGCLRTVHFAAAPTETVLLSLSEHPHLYQPSGARTLARLYSWSGISGASEVASVGASVSRPRRVGLAGAACCASMWATTPASVRFSSE